MAAPGNSFRGMALRSQDVPFESDPSQPLFLLYSRPIFSRRRVWPGLDSRRRAGRGGRQQPPAEKRSDTDSSPSQKGTTPREKREATPFQPHTDSSPTTPIPALAEEKRHRFQPTFFKTRARYFWMNPNSDPVRCHPLTLVSVTVWPETQVPGDTSARKLPVIVVPE